MTADFTKQRNFIAQYADCYNADRCKREKLTTNMIDKMCEFLYDASVDQLYDACLFVTEKETNYRYRDVKPTLHNTEMEETYHILGLHFWGHLRNRLYEYNRTGAQDFYHMVAAEQQNTAHSVHSLQKTYTERYGWRNSDGVEVEQCKLQRELATSQSKLDLLRYIMTYAPRTQEQSQEQGQERC